MHIIVIIACSLILVVGTYLGFVYDFNPLDIAFSMVAIWLAFVTLRLMKSLELTMDDIIKYGMKWLFNVE